MKRPILIPLNRPAAVNLALAGLFVIVWLFYPKAYHFSDMAWYLARAHDLGNLLDWEMDFHFQHRLGLLLPHWVSYQLFGVSHFTSFLPQLGFLLIILFCVLHWCDNLLQKTAASLALLPLLPYTVDARPDLGVTCFMFLALCMLGQRHRAHRGALFGVLFTLAAFYGFLVKAVAYFMALPFAIALIADYLSRGKALRDRAAANAGGG